MDQKRHSVRSLSKVEHHRAGRTLVEFRVLGPVELWVDDRQRELGSAKERNVLAILLLAAGQPVSIEAIIDRLWDDEAPPKARGSVHTYIARLRGRLHRQLGEAEARVVSRPGTYALEVDPERVDLQRFRRLHAQARAIADSGDDEHALQLLDEAEELWRGEPLSGLSGEWVRQVRTSIENVHQEAIGERLTLALAAGRHAELVGELYGLVVQHPYNESFVEHLMVTLYRCGRQGDALEAYRQARHRLVGDLGAEPAPSLRGMFERILHGDSDLAAPPVRRRAHNVPLADNLPRDTPDFTGREVELSQLFAVASSTSTAVAITAVDGMAGIGKSALVLHAAHRLAERYPDGRLYLHLRAHDPNRSPVDPADGLEALLRLVGEDPQRIPMTLEERAALWRARLASRRALIVLDDVADPDQVRPFLPGASGCFVLITSRHRLTGLDGVRPLSLDLLASNEAARLFRQIVGHDRPLDARAVDEVVQLCGHLPLAITIVANQLRHRPARAVGDLAARLSGARDRLADMQAGDNHLTTAFELSYRALSPVRRRAFRRLGLHVGADLGADAAAALIGCAPAEAGRVLEELIDRHLVEEPRAGRVRFHDLLRVFARERAAAEESSEEPQRVVRRLLDFYLHTAARADRTLFPHRRRVDVDVSCVPADPPAVDELRTASAWLNAERANILACIRYAAEREISTHAVRLSHVLATYLERSARWEDAAQVHEIAYRVCRETGDRRGAADAELDLSLAHSRTGHNDSAFEHARSALDAFRELGDRYGEAETFDHLARVCWLSGRNQTALSYAERALELFRSAGEEHGEANALLHRGIALWHLGRAAEAVPVFERSREIFRSVGDRANEAVISNNLGEILLGQGYHRDALALFGEALSILREVAWRQNEAVALNNIANIHRYRGRYAESLHFYREALSVYRETGDRRHEADALSNIGTIYLQQDRHAEALIHFQKALSMSREIRDLYEETRALHSIGEAQRGSGRFSLAQESYERALSIARDVADPYLEACCLEGLGETVFRIRGRKPAEALWRQALVIFERIGAAEGGTLRARLDAVDAIGS
jgi:DNA-binding SARP family transcriptional activator/Flp pilus assembly protein TadD